MGPGSSGLLKRVGLRDKNKVMRESRKSLYEVLGVARDASAEEVKQAFRRAALQHHPDRNPGGEDSSRRFREAAAAYEVLGDAKARACYDRGLTREDRAQVKPGPGGFARTQRPGSAAGIPRRGADRRQDLVITLEEAAQGGLLRLEVPSGRACGVCRGTGRAATGEQGRCPRCLGWGEVRRMLGPIAVFDACPECLGSGSAASAPCPACSGMGTEPGTETLEIRLPAGMFAGGQLRVPGLGEPGLMGGPAGDLVVRVHVDSGPVRDRGGRSWSACVFPWLGI